jgi:hypothetical protein
MSDESDDDDLIETITDAAGNKMTVMKTTPKKAPSPVPPSEAPFETSAPASDLIIGAFPHFI